MMKKKKFSKRLSLNKTTVANLDEGLMGVVMGGDTGLSDCIMCHTQQYNCTTQDPNQICVNTCRTCECTSILICGVTECC
jgi:hypothetical protein